LLRPKDLERRLAQRLELLRRAWPESEEVRRLSASELAGQQLDLAEPFASCIGDVTTRIAEALERRENVLFEGAQGTLLDVDHGTFPYVTSSSTTFAGLGNSIGIAAPDVERRLGVCKAYQTRVGEGPFPTELEGEEGESLREKGGEFGVTTGRPRRCGWLDGVALRYAVKLNTVTSLSITKLDVLDDVREVRIAVAYELNGKRIERFPLSAEELAACVPVYETLEGWETPTADVRAWEDLPPAARAYIERIESIAGAPAEIVSVGPEPEATIRREL